MLLAHLMASLDELFLGWPLIIYVIAAALICTFALRFIQVTYFKSSWMSLFKPEAVSKGEVTPLQAFINTLSSNLGNGSVAGMAVAVHSGGPGAAFWMVVVGFFMMAVRFCEVYLSIFFGQEKPRNSALGGPMLYLQKIPFGNSLAWIYGTGCLFFGLVVGNGVQTNAIGASLHATWGIEPIISASVLTLLIWYILTGGAQRISRASAAVVPIKVIVFFSSAFIVLGYHYANIIPALVLIMTSAFKPTALMGGIAGFTVQYAMRYGMSSGAIANESGLGTAAILYSSTGSHAPVRDGIVSMLSTFISVIVGFIISLCIVASGIDAWSNENLTGIALTIAAYNTVFGIWGGWIVTFLSITFGIGVIISFGYITRETWLYVTNNKGSIFIFNALYCTLSFICTLAKVDFVWKTANIISGGMLFINLFALMYLLPVIKDGVKKYASEK